MEAPSATAMEEMDESYAEDTPQEEESKRGMKRERTHEGADDDEEEQGRVRASVSLIVTSGPPWYDARTGEVLDETLVQRGIQSERESLQSFPAYVEVPENEVRKKDGRLINSRWVLTKKGEGRVKARLVAQGINRGDWQDVFAATPSGAAIRLVLAVALKWSLTIIFGDLSTAFLYAYLPETEKIYLDPPASEKREGYVWRVLRAIYGLRRSPQAFQDHFAGVVTSLGYERLVSDPQVYVHRKNRCLLLAHVDDLILATPQEHLQARQHVLPAYFEDVLKEVNMIEAKPVGTPYIQGAERLGENLDSALLDDQRHHIFRRAVGRLMWTVSDRPDLFYAVKELARPLVIRARWTG